MSRSNEYLMDRLNSDIRMLKAQVAKLTEENDALYSECKFGALVTFLLGIGIGTAVCIAVGILL